MRAHVCVCVLCVRPIDFTVIMPNEIILAMHTFTIARVALRLNSCLKLNRIVGN